MQYSISPVNGGKYEETRQTTERTGSALNCHHGGGTDAGGRYDKGIGGGKRSVRKCSDGRRL